MTNEPGSEQSDADARLEQEIRQGRQFTPQEAMARMAGPGAMKGASPVSPQKQAEVSIGNWLKSQATDSCGILQIVLLRHLKGSPMLLENIDRPLVALHGYCRRLLDSDHLLEDFVREVDVEWGRRMDERPYFDRPGAPADAEDPYTLRSVRSALEEVTRQLADEIE
jgi:hypothetical protein